MPFTSLLLTGLVPNGKFKENHVGVALVPSDQAEGETMLLFSADKCDLFHNVYLRKTQPEKPTSDQQEQSKERDVYHRKTQPGEPTPSCCDLVCFAHKLKYNNGEYKPEITICFIELIGGKKDQTEKASHQILQTYNRIQEGIREIEGVNIIWKALIIIKSSLSQSAVDEILRDLKKTFKPENVCHTYQARNINLTKFMQTSEIKTV